MEPDQILKAIQQIIQNPAGTSIGMGIVALIVGLAYWFVSKKIAQQKIEQAKRDTETEQASKVAEQLQKNQQAADQDAANRQKL